jgi:cytidyltransferase-like protein
MTLNTLVLVSGGFDPLHSGHIKYLDEASQLGDTLIVGLNSDAWLARKKGRCFMPWEERYAVLYNLSQVTNVFSFDDSDDSARDLIRIALELWPNHKIIFANGGDRGFGNTPEMSITDPRLTFQFGVGGHTKQASSSDFLKAWCEPVWVERPWGRWCVVDEGIGFKVKRLEIFPDQSISLQYHNKRSEQWTVVKGFATASVNGKVSNYDVGGTFTVPVGQLHRVYNNGAGLLVCIEVQYGVACEEEDIVRV